MSICVKRSLSRYDNFQLLHSAIGHFLPRQLSPAGRLGSPRSASILYIYAHAHDLDARRGLPARACMPYAYVPTGPDINTTLYMYYISTMPALAARPAQLFCTRFSARTTLLAQYVHHVYAPFFSLPRVVASFEAFTT